MQTAAGRLLLHFGPFVVLTIGMIAFSQGLSFARWNEFAPPDARHNLHALLITLAGVGLFVAGLLLHRMHERIRELEERASSGE